MLERRPRSLQRQQEIRDLGVALGIQRVGLEDLLPCAERSFEISAPARQLGGGAQPVDTLRRRPRLRQQFLRAVEPAELVEGPGRVQQQIRIVRVDLQRLFESLGAFPGLMQMPEPLSECGQRTGRARSVSVGAGLEEPPRGLGSTEEARRLEIGQRKLLVLVVERCGKAVKLERLIEAPRFPLQLGQDEKTPPIEKPRAKDFAQDLPGLAMTPRVLGQLLGQAPRQDGMTPRLRADPLEELQAFVLPAELVQTGQFAELVARVAGELLQHDLGKSERAGRIGIVAGQRAPDIQGEQVLGGLRGHFFVETMGLRAIVRFQSELDGVCPIPQIDVGQFDPIQETGTLGRDHDHSPGPRPARGLQQLATEQLAYAAEGGIANEESPATSVVADHRLHVALGRPGRGQRERYSSIEKSHRTVPGHCELTRRPAVALGPGPLAVGRRSVVADLLRDLDVLDLAGPEAADRRERGGSASPMVLLDEAHGQLHSADVGGGRLQPVGDRSEERRLGESRKTNGGLELAKSVMGVRSLAGQGACELFLQQRRKLLDPVQAHQRAGVVLELGLKERQEPVKRSALGTANGFKDQPERTLVVAHRDEPLGRAEHGLSVTGTQGDRPLRGIQRLRVTILCSEHSRANDMNPRQAGRTLDSLRHRLFRSPEVPEVGQQASPECEQTRPQLVRKIIWRAVVALKPPRLPRTPDIGYGVAREIPSLRIVACRAPRAEVERVPESAGAELVRETPRQDLRRSALPLAQRPVVFGAPVGLHVEAVFVKLPDSTQLVRRNPHATPAGRGLGYGRNGPRSARPGSIRRLSSGRFRRSGCRPARSGAAS